jgi:hypothetical protein
MRTIEQRTSFLQAVTFSREQLDEVDRVIEWLADFPDEAASYIVWLEDAITPQTREQP